MAAGANVRIAMAVTTKEQPLLGKVAIDNILLLVVDIRRYREVEHAVKLKAPCGGTPAEGST
jgi:hypothetical protein